MMMMGASFLEILWTGIGICGFGFTCWLMLIGWLDFRSVEQAIRMVPPRARRWGPRWWVGLSAIVSNGVVLLVWLGFILVGVIAMQYPPPPPSVEQTVSTIWIGYVLIGMEGLLALVQGWHVFVRGKVEQTDRTRFRRPYDAASRSERSPRARDLRD